MKRDLDLQTKILQLLEDAGPNEMVVSVDGYSYEQFCYDARQLHRAGLIDIHGSSGRLACWATGLTPRGHDVLDRARAEWQQKATATGGRVVQITFETVLRKAVEIIRSSIP